MHIIICIEWSILHYNVFFLLLLFTFIWARPLRGQAIRLYLFMARDSPVPELAERQSRAIKRIPRRSFALVQATGLFRKSYNCWCRIPSVIYIINGSLLTYTQLPWPYKHRTRHPGNCRIPVPVYIT